jgi:hypothetical protein
VEEEEIVIVAQRIRGLLRAAAAVAALGVLGLAVRWVWVAH